MKSANILSKKLFGGLFASALCLLSINAAHAQIYVSNFSNGTVGEYDATTGAAINSSLISGLDGAGNIIESGNDLYVVNAGYNTSYGPPPPGANATIGVYTSTGAIVNASLISLGFADPGGIVISGSDMFVANDSLNTIGEYNALTGAVINASLVTGLNNPLGLAVSGSDIYVMNNGTGTVGEYDITTGNSVNASLITGLGDSSIGLAISGSNLFVTSFGDGTIGEYDATTGNAVNAPLITGLYGPAGALKISGSNLFITNNGNSGNNPNNLTTGTIGEYTTSGATVNVSLIPGTGLVGGLAVLTQTTPTPVTPTSKPTTVSSGSSYSTVTPVTSFGGLGTTVSLVGGLANADQTVTLSANNLGANFTSLASDVVGVSGNAGSVFALKLTFDLTAANQNGGASDMTLLWLNPTTGLWENSVDGNTGTNTTNPSFLDYQGTFAQFEAQYGVTDANLGDYLGAYGVSTSNDTVWAVINHNSSFGVGNPLNAPQEVPEPSTWALLLGGLGLLAFGRKRLSLNSLHRLNLLKK